MATQDLTGRRALFTLDPSVRVQQPVQAPLAPRFNANNFIDLTIDDTATPAPTVLTIHQYETPRTFGPLRQNIREEKSQALDVLPPNTHPRRVDRPGARDVPDYIFEIEPENKRKKGKQVPLPKGKKHWYCALCKLEVLTRSTMDQHYDAKHRERTVKCRVDSCHEMFGADWIELDHWKSEHWGQQVRGSLQIFFRT